MTMQTYQGACHCEAVKFEAALDLDSTMVCNCSRCQKLGWVMAFTPRTNMTILKGEDAVRQYTFNKERILHQFCPTCGIQTFAYAAAPDGTAMAAVNVNCLDGVEPRALPSKPVDGRSR